MIDKIIKSAQNICWYPSAGRDIATAYFFNTFSEAEKADLFIFTDPVYRDYTRLNFRNLMNYNSENQNITNRFHDVLARSLEIENINCRTVFFVGNYDFGIEVTREGNQDGVISPVYFAKILVNQNTETEREISVLFVGCSNESFCNNYLYRKNIKVKYLAFKNARGYGGYMSGLWIFNTMRRLNTKFIATEIKPNGWNEGDDNVIQVYPDLGPVVQAPIYSEEYRAVIIHLNQEDIVCPTKFTREMLRFDWEYYDRTTNSAFFGINELPENF